MNQIRHSFTIPLNGGPDLYNKVRAALIAQGSNLNLWCKSNGINRQTVDKALKGERIGSRSRIIREKLIHELFARPERTA